VSNEDIGGIIMQKDVSYLRGLMMLDAVSSDPEIRREITEIAQIFRERDEARKKAGPAVGHNDAQEGGMDKATSERLE
jgi:hypothetical protein